MRKAIRKTLSGLITGRMAENGISKEEGARIINMSEDTLYRRLQNPDDLKLGELRRLCCSLDITVDEAKPYLW